MILSSVYHHPSSSRNKVGSQGSPKDFWPSQPAESVCQDLRSALGSRYCLIMSPTALLTHVRFFDDVLHVYPQTYTVRLGCKGSTARPVLNQVAPGIMPSFNVMCVKLHKSA
jgi:hypothetical protein